MVLPILLNLGESIGSTIGHDLLAGAHTLVDVIGPGISWFAGLIHDHEGEFEFFVDVVLGGIAVKWAVLTGLKTVSAIGDLAAAVIGFPLRQTGQIGEALAAVRTSWVSVAEESTALGSAVSGAFGAIYRPVMNTTEALTRYVQISTGQVDPAMIASARATAGPRASAARPGVRDRRDHPGRGRRRCRARGVPGPRRRLHRADDRGHPGRDRGRSAGGAGQR